MFIVFDSNDCSGCEIPADDVAAMATVEDVVNYLKNNGIED